MAVLGLIVLCFSGLLTTGWWPESGLVHNCFGTNCALFLWSAMANF